MCLKKLFKGYEKYASIPLRVFIGVIFIFMGYSKIIGGVEGFAGMIALPAALAFAWLVTLIEFVGGIFIFLGIYTRYFAIAQILVMIGAIAMVTGSQGFTSYMVNLALIGGLSALVLLGAGELSLEKKIKGKEC